MSPIELPQVSPQDPPIRYVTVIGAGNMGHQIALHAAICGFTVVCTDIDGQALVQADKFVETYLTERKRKGRLTLGQVQRARQNISFTDDLSSAVSQADYVIEAIVEVLDAKRKLFSELDQLAPAHAILATNSSFIASSRIADATQRPDKVINLHFVNPALVMKLVEVVQGPHASEQTAQYSMALSRQLQKTPVWIKKEVEGFALNRILNAVMQEANWLLEMGVASIEDIDTVCRLGAGHPLGPFQLGDLTGIDLAYTVAMEKFNRTGNRVDLPIPTLVEHYAKGEYGKKTGKGWYNYQDEK